MAQTGKPKLHSFGNAIYPLVQGNDVAFARGDVVANDSLSTTVFFSDDLRNYGDDFFNGYSVRVLSATNITALSTGIVSDYVSLTGQFTLVSAMDGAFAADDDILLGINLKLAGQQAVEAIMHPGTITGGLVANTAFADTAFTPFPNDVFNDSYSIIIINSTNIASGTIVNVQDFVSATGTFTTADIGAAYTVGDTFVLFPNGMVNNLADAAATGAPDTDTSLMAYIKQLVNELQVVDRVVDAGVPQMVSVQTPDAGGDNWTQAAHALFTVTGTALVRVFGVVDETLVGAGTLEVGAVGATAGLIAQVANATTLAAGDIVTNAETATLVPVGVLSEFAAMSDLDIDVTIGAANITNGQITFYCQWLPVSAGATVAAAVWD